MKVVCIVQARTTSERFPCKIFAGLRKRPMLAHVLERAAAIQGVDQVVLAVPEADVRLVAHLWPHVAGGSEKDVLSRYVLAAKQYEADVIVRVTGDCPLLASDLASRALSAFQSVGTGYLAMCQPYSPVADGWDAEVFSNDVLFYAADKATKGQREHVTTWMRESGMPVLRIPLAYEYTALKCSVDTREDLQRVETIMEHLTDPTDFSKEATWEAWVAAGKP
jgi:spore coat polysaccharide biosynthesis protein SpsF (cytidylyltransferase family)